ncbi:hypothetical protein H310_06819 [Aphanomyces invadans]|uniref:Uncharacterized protein n=1 Tax=Aphanomyces invadans TaxID=157072 RepID=A0A024U6J1_9STRA|nr:hypothetical protein H310_06819 [Aphanomyces invadans]ETW01233.1 hypothetical protein H310_06819 [Aphanomyces invadans]|eukprot:XP_008870231.1 hypothetical protein H310_06819 [Aphanomyces invadans]
MPACTWAASTCRHVVIVVDIAAIRDKTAIVSELEWVAGPGAVLVLVTSDANDVVFYSQRQIEFHHVLLSAASVATTVDQVMAMVPDVDAVTVLTTAPLSLTTFAALLLSTGDALSLHVVADATRLDAFPPPSAYPFGLPLLLAAIRHLITQLWRTVSGDSFVAVVSHDHQRNHFDMYLSAKGGVSMATMCSRLVDSLPSFMEIRPPNHRHSDNVSFVDVLVTACYSIAFRLVLFRHGCPAPVCRTLNAAQALFHRRPCISEPVQEWFAKVLDNVPLPFPDLHRSRRVLAACLARGYVRLHPTPSNDAFDQHMTEWEETEWLVCLAHSDVDAIALCHAFHVPLDDGPSTATSTHLRDLELQVVREILQQTKPSSNHASSRVWFVLSRAGHDPSAPSRWQDYLQVCQRFSRAFPTHVVFCHCQIGLARSTVGAATPKRTATTTLEPVRLTDVRTGQQVVVFV